MENSNLVIPKKFNSKIKLIQKDYLDNGLIYIYVIFISKLTPKDRGNLLLDLEDEMCIINSNVRVWHVPLGDKNSLRNLRGITVN